MPLGATAAARLELAHELLDELHNIDEQLRSTKKRITRIVAASKTTLTDLYGVGPIIAATVLGDVGDIHRFASRDQFAAYNGTAPIEASSGNHIVHRLSRRGNRQLNHAIHMAAVTQIRHHGTTGRIYYQRKIAEGMARKSALRALKRKISDALYARMIADARRAARANEGGPGGQTGNDSASSATGSHPERRLFGKATPGSPPTVRPLTSRPTRPRPHTDDHDLAVPLDNNEASICTRCSAR